MKVTEIIYSLKENKLYTLPEVLQEFTSKRNKTKNDILGYTLHDLQNIIEDEISNKMESFDCSKNISFLLDKYSIFWLFEKICGKIELFDNRTEIDEKELSSLVKKNMRELKRFLDSKSSGKCIGLDEEDIVDLIDIIFSKNKEYIYTITGGRPCVTEKLKGVARSIDNNGKYIIIKDDNSINQLFSMIENIVTVWRERYYSISDVIDRLKYPALLDNYYINSPYVYYKDDNWIKYDISYIQRLIKKDYEGKNEFPKVRDWRIYGSDGNYKDRFGVHDLGEKYIPRPEGIDSINSGTLMYYMNTAYCKSLIYELERRALKQSYQITENEIKIQLLDSLKDNMLHEKIEEILQEIWDNYYNSLKCIISDNFNKINMYLYNIDIIEDLEKYCYTGLDTNLCWCEFKQHIDSLAKLDYKEEKFTTISKNIDEILKSKYMDKKDKINIIAKKIYNKQIKSSESIQKNREKFYTVQGECSKIYESIIQSKIAFIEQILYNLHKNGRRQNRLQKRGGLRRSNRKCRLKENKDIVKLYEQVHIKLREIEY